jgi:hypothetical protein
MTGVIEEERRDDRATVGGPPRPPTGTRANAAIARESASDPPPSRPFRATLRGPMGQVVLLSLTASLNPTLVAATTVILLLDKPARLTLGYLLGAYVTSITLGLVIVFSLSNSTTTNTTENMLRPGGRHRRWVAPAGRCVGGLERSYRAL